MALTRPVVPPDGSFIFGTGFQRSGVACGAAQFVDHKFSVRMWGVQFLRVLLKRESRRALRDAALLPFRLTGMEPTTPYLCGFCRLLRAPSLHALDNEKVFHRISLSHPTDSSPVASASVSLLRANLWHIPQTWHVAATLLRAGAALPSNGWNISLNCSRLGAGAAFTPSANFLKTSRKPRPPSQRGATC
jgi:hypothetical protein